MKKTKIYEGVVVPLSKVNLFRDTEGNLNVMHCNCMGSKHWANLGCMFGKQTYPIKPDVRATCPKCGLYPWYFVKKNKSQIRQRFHPIWAGTPEWKETLK
jgi:hypothetical protein